MTGVSRATRREIIEWIIIAALVIGGMAYATARTWYSRPAQGEVIGTRGGMGALPLAPVALIPAPDARLVESYCTMCHSIVPIVRHAGFSDSIWGAEVEKMRRKYGAGIPDDVAARITRYLQAHYAGPVPASFGTLDQAVITSLTGRGYSLAADTIDE